MTDKQILDILEEYKDTIFVDPPASNYHLRNKPEYNKWSLYLRGSKIAEGNTLRECFYGFDINQYKEQIVKERQQFADFNNEALHWP